jgi:S1-C subfamily serine protease
MRSIAAAGRTLALLAAAAPAVAEPAASWQALMDRHAAAIVNLRVTLSSEMEGSGAPAEESTDEVRGAVVDPSGLILVWNSHLSAGRMSELFAGGGDGARLKVTATEVRVTLPGESRERRAFVAASDSSLDLAFVQLEEMPEGKLAAIDFGDAAPIAVGDELATISRLSSAFDRVAYVDVVRVGGELRKPRPAWILTGGNATQAGLPYFAADGRPVGVLVTFLSRAGDPTSRNPAKLFAELMSLGRGQIEVGPVGLFLLPAERVAAVIGQARERARELLEERKAAAAPPATP